MKAPAVTHETMESENRTAVPFTLPGVSLTVCLTFDVDAVSLWTSTFRSSSPSDISRGEFGPRVGVPRILDLLAHRNICATFFVPAVTARQFPELVREVADRGHEIGAHGDLHERLIGLEPAEEEQIHRRSLEALRELLGSAPTGYRAPGWELTPSTIGLLEMLGFSYDSSQMATDFTPYRARRDDRVVDGEWTRGSDSTVWEIPVAWELDDFPHFFLRPPHFLPGRSIEEIETLWEAEFAYAYDHVPGGVFTLTMHPQVIGRGPRLEMLERLISRMAERDGVRFARIGDVVSELSQPA
jgi:peptidoglycan/xylan/chitin deacetylase (PgdA/CDA1 family)